MTDWPDIVLRLGCAAVLGGAIGLNRNLHGKPSGLRTLALVGLGAAMMLLVASEARGDASAVSRVLQGLLAGIGFLGAGVILHEVDRQKVHGLTTAASIWIVACLGAACGVGAWHVAVVAAGIVAAVLIWGGHLEKQLHRRLQGPKMTEGDKPD